MTQQQQQFRSLIIYLKDKAGVILYFSYCQQIPWKYQNQQCVSLSLNPHPVWVTQPQVNQFLLKS